MRHSAQFDLKLLGILLGMFVAVLFLWNFPLIYPIKVFVVLLHEISHGLAALLTGGSISRIEISPQLGGLCYFSGGWELVVLPAGYLGSIVWGGLILVVSARSRADRILAFAIGTLTVLVTLLYVRGWFGFVFGLLFGLALVALSLFAAETWNDWTLKFLGLTSVLYAFIDIKEDLVSRTVPGSDAYVMAKRLFLPPVFWGVLWLLLALAAAVFFLFLAARGESRPPTPAPFPNQTGLPGVRGDKENKMV